MSTWKLGASYDYYGTPIVCVRRYFVGALEMVDLAHAESVTAAAVENREPTTITRTARALAPCVKPKVTATLGGVLRPDACDHRHYQRLVADAGPNAGKTCCSACGGAVEPAEEFHV